MIDGSTSHVHVSGPNVLVHIILRLFGRARFLGGEEFRGEPRRRRLAHIARADRDLSLLARVRNVDGCWVGGFGGAGKVLSRRAVYKSVVRATPKAGAIFLVFVVPAEATQDALFVRWSWR